MKEGKKGNSSVLSHPISCFPVVKFHSTADTCHEIFGLSTWLFGGCFGRQILPLQYIISPKSRVGGAAVWMTVCDVLPAMELILGSIVGYSWLARLRNGDSASRAVVLEVSGKF